MHGGNVGFSYFLSVGTDIIYCVKLFASVDLNALSLLSSFYRLPQETNSVSHSNNMNSYALLIRNLDLDTY